MKEPIVSVEWLKSNLNDPDLILLDASQNDNKAGKTSDLNGLQIPNAITFDLKKNFSCQSSSFPNMLPDPDVFEKASRKLGINYSSKIVVYDNLGVYFSPRVWWMFKTMGHLEIAVLDGGLPDWMEKGYETETKTNRTPKTGNFRSSFNPKLVKNFETIKENTRTEEFILIDARSSGRFLGQASEPRKGLKSGNIPNSINLPFDQVLNHGNFKSKKELKLIFDQLKIEDKPITFSCGSGVTACIVLLASELVCSNEKAIYDGSWTEWIQKV